MNALTLNAPNSQALFDRARAVMPSGYTRQMAVQDPHPRYAEGGDGCWVTDVEGVRRIDYVNNFTALIHDIDTNRIHPILGASCPSCS